MILLNLFIIILIVSGINGEKSLYYDAQSNHSDGESVPTNIRLFDLRQNADNSNASLYISSLESENLDSVVLNNSQISGRSAKALDLDALFGEKSESKYYHGNRESRIINDDSEKKSGLSIKGFIPIVGLGSDNSETNEKPPKIPNYNLGPSQYSQTYNFENLQNAPQHNAGPSDQRFIGAALQNFASKLSGKPNRKYGSNDNSYGIDSQDCVCVPFYLCKNGYLESDAKNANPNKPNNEVVQSLMNRLGLPSQHQQMQSQQLVPSYQQLISAYQQQMASEQQQRVPSHQQPQSQQNDYLPIDERTVDENERFVQNYSVPQYADDVLGRMLGVRSEGCGILRTCCKVLPESIHSFGDYSISGVPQSPIDVKPFGGYHQLEKPHYHNKYHLNKPIKQNPFEIVAPSIVVPHTHAHGHQIVEAGYGFPSGKPLGGHHGHQNVYSERPYAPQIPLPIKHKPIYQPPHIPTQPIYKPPSLYPGHKPYPEPHSLDPIEHPHHHQQHQHSYPHHHPHPHDSIFGVCGVRNADGIHGRVQNLNYHETAAEFGEYPWQIAILKRLGPADSLYVCGGTIISPWFILTAAHCIKNNQPNDLKIRLGEWDVHRDDEFYPHIEKFVHEIIIHPEYFPGNLVNDIALIRMDSPIDLTLPHISPICIPERFESFAGQRCLVTGWGKNAFGNHGEFQSVLKEVDLPVLNHGECEHSLRQTRLGRYYKLHQSMICAGGEPGKDACEGDGGSPLVCEEKGIWKVAGLVSWGVGCGQPGVPGVYVNVGYFRPWIENIIRHNVGHNPIPVLNGIISERSNANSNYTQVNDNLSADSKTDSEITTEASSNGSS